ncbi:alpha/beta fold hydrolase [Sporosarcina cyprini]|uniref:alpha/beta fold hydrolase n=1 Tax=Sporosarcina cyprini TaxID=2910523 RepID=UPI001EE09B09|nr:alpha/beta hydrolase [Sporosarcina cyprini]MCG3088519.1 alpha/beta hydrolase [Sporosarcina cyprini]
MSKIRKKKGKKILRVFAWILGIIVCLNVIGFAVNKIFFANELEAISPYGKMVEVNNQNMHVYSMGQGEKTIVLLPGFGLPLPSADFGPLMRELSKDYTVVTVEYFGMGFSDETDTPRTNENYMEEIRTALSQADIKPPYVLMPHSASGVYSEYYASQYPEEVSAIIMLDTTPTVSMGSNLQTFMLAPRNVKIIYGFSTLLQETGVNRIINGLLPSEQTVENDYTEKEISDNRLFSYHVVNDTIINQISSLNDNINEVNSIVFPAEVPVLKLISSVSQKQLKNGEEIQKDHVNRLGTNAEFQIIDGSHGFYQTHVTEICDATKNFLDKID